MNKLKKVPLAIIVLYLSISNLSSAPLVSTNWLLDNLNNQNIKILDIRNKIDGGSLDTFIQSHIPGAVYSNYLEDGWRVKSKDGVPGILPELSDLENLIQNLGISNNDHVIIVSGGNSSTDFGSAARIYWTLKTLSHDQVSILNGGFKSWQEENLPLESGTNNLPKSDFKAVFNNKYLALSEDVKNIIGSSNAELIDARPKIQYTGEEKSNIVSRYGTIKSSKNLEQNSLTFPNSSKLKPVSEIEDLLLISGIDRNLNKITFCNTGHWATVSWFALSEYLGLEGVKMYDGSLAEWDNLGYEIKS